MEIGDICTYIYIYMVHAKQYSSAGPVVRHVGKVKCQL